jgi:hypothetical protein
MILGMVNQDGKSTHGGAGRGQGMKPFFGETMPSIQLKLARVLRDFLDDADKASPRLRALLEWGVANQDQVLEDPGPPPKEDIVRTSYSLTPAHVELAEQLGAGNRVAGVRRVIHTAMSLGLDPDQLP